MVSLQDEGPPAAAGLQEWRLLLFYSAATSCCSVENAYIFGRPF